ncbi:MAG TPA: hypothetical protein VE713_18815 [Pyrinomonadaceae bacterium]|jgi:hypothetical protein|nr:hypothetical protein [Pyrinomonadaceae bacterium]
MKRCPTCNRTFDDPALAFCTADGTPLVADAPAYQQPPPQQPQQPQYQPAGQQFYPPPPPQMSFGQQPAGRSAGFAKTAFILGLISLFLFLVAMLRMLMRWAAFRYNASTPSDVAFWATFVIGFLLLLLAMLLGLIGLIQSFRNPARYGGKALAFLGPFLGVLAAVITLSVFSYARMKAPTQVYTYNTNTYSNSNTYSSNSNTYSSNSNASKPSSSTMTDDERYKLFFAASKTGDKQLALRAFQKIGIVDQSGMPTSEYKSFLAGSFAWALKNTDFIQTIPTADKARDYVNSHM